MGCSRCGQNNRPQSTYGSNPPRRPGSSIPSPNPPSPRPTAVNPSDIVKNAINGLRYVPNR